MSPWLRPYLQVGLILHLLSAKLPVDRNMAALLQIRPPKTSRNDLCTIISPNRKSEELTKWHYRDKRDGRRKPKRVKELINGINSSNLLYPPRKPISRDCGWKLKLATINTRSLRNKTGNFLDHIIDDIIDICTITETWLKGKDEDTRSELNIDGYVFKDVTRGHRQGGGCSV